MTVAPEKVRLRMVVTIDYDADVDNYYFNSVKGFPVDGLPEGDSEHPDPVAMAAIDQAGWDNGSLQISDFDDDDVVVTAVFGPAPDESLEFVPGDPSHKTTKVVRFNGLHEMIGDR